MFIPAAVRVDSLSHQLDLLQDAHRGVCDQITACREAGDREGAAVAVHELLAVEGEFERLGLRAPVRRFRVYEKGEER